MKTINDMIWGQDADKAEEIAPMNDGIFMSCTTHIRCRMCGTLVIAGRRCPTCNTQN